MPSRPKRLITNPRTVLPPELIVRASTPPPEPRPFSSMIGVPEKPSWLVASRMTASVIAGSAAVMEIDCGPPPPIEKFAVWTPTIAFELRMNCRNVPCCSRALAMSSSIASPRALTIAVKLKPESTFATLPPATDTLVTCSAPVSVMALSDVPAPVRSRPP